MLFLFIFSLLQSHILFTKLDCESWGKGTFCAFLTENGFQKRCRTIKEESLENLPHHTNSYRLKATTQREKANKSGRTIFLIVYYFYVNLFTKILSLYFNMLSKNKAFQQRK